MQVLYSEHAQEWIPTEIWVTENEKTNNRTVNQTSSWDKRCCSSPAPCCCVRLGDLGEGVDCLEYWVLLGELEGLDTEFCCRGLGWAPPSWYPDGGWSGWSVCYCNATMYKNKSGKQSAHIKYQSERLSCSCQVRFKLQKNTLNCSEIFFFYIQPHS